MGSGTPPADARLEKQRQVHELLTKANEAYMRGDVASAREKCNEVLKIEPDNTQARFMLGLIERRAGGAGFPGGRSPVSALPDAAHLREAVENARTTVPKVVLPSDLAASSAAAGTLHPRRAAVVPSQAPPPAKTPSWLSLTLLLWVAAAILVILVMVFIVLVFERFLAGKRQRIAQARLFEQLQIASAIAETAGEGEAAAAQAAFAAVAPAEEYSSPAPADEERSAPDSPPDDREIDYWGGGAEKKKVSPTAVPMVDQAAGGESPAAPEEEDVIPAEKAFAGEVAPAEESTPSGEIEIGDLEPGEPAPEGEFPAGPGAAPAGGGEETPEPAEPPFLSSLEPLAEDDSGPISLEGIAIQTPSIEGDTGLRGPGEVDSLSGDRDFGGLRVETLSDEEKEETSPSSLGIGGAPAGTEGPDSEGALRLSDEVSADEVASIRLEGEVVEEKETSPPSPPPVPAGKEKPKPADTDPVAPKKEPIPAEPDELADLEEEEGPDRDYLEEIVVAEGRPTQDKTAPLSGEEIGSDSTMVNSRARHKAVFQDQLARGLDAMEKGHWHDAVRFLSVAHAMDPTDQYALEKLREARKKRDEESSDEGGD